MRCFVLVLRTIHFLQVSYITTADFGVVWHFLVILASTLQMWYRVQMGLFWIHIGPTQLLPHVFVSWCAEESECLGGMVSSLKKFWLCIIVCCSTILINWTCGSYWRHPVCSSEQYRSWLLCFNSAKPDCGSLGSLLKLPGSSSVVELVSNTLPCSGWLKACETLPGLLSLCCACNFLLLRWWVRFRGRFCSLWKFSGTLFQWRVN